MTHREWGYNNIGASMDRAKEHNATVRAYRDAMAECDRLGKANDEACDRIADLEREWQHAKDNCHDGIEYTESLKKDFFEMEEKLKALESRPVLTWEECEEEFYHVCGHFPNSSQGSFMGWLKSRLPAPTDSIRVPFSDEQIEELARVLQKAYAEKCGGLKKWDDWPAGVRDGFLAEARAAVDFMRVGPPVAGVDPDAWQTPLVLPSVGELEDIIENHIGWLREDPDDSGYEAVKVVGLYDAAEAILTALRPWLREPTGWELDVTAREVQAAYYRHQSGSPEGQCWHQVIELLRARIRPTFECAECAKNKSERDVMYRDWDDCRNRMLAVRLALNEGSES